VRLRNRQGVEVVRKRYAALRLRYEVAMRENKALRAERRKLRKQLKEKS